MIRVKTWMSLWAKLETCIGEDDLALGTKRARWLASKRIKHTSGILIPDCRRYICTNKYMQPLLLSSSFGVIQPTIFQLILARSTWFIFLPNSNKNSRWIPCSSMASWSWPIYLLSQVSSLWCSNFHLLLERRRLCMDPVAESHTQAWGPPKS